MSYSADARQLALNVYHNSGHSIETTAKLLGISKTTLHEWLTREKNDEPLQDRTHSGRPRVLDEKQRARLLELRQLHPDWTQERFAAQLEEEFDGLEVSQSIICLEFKRHQSTLKKSTGELTKSPPSESNG